VFSIAKDIISNRRHRLSSLTIQKVIVLKDSILSKDIQEEGLLPPDKVDDLLDLPACPTPEEILAKDQDKDVDEQNFDSIDVGDTVDSIVQGHNL
jgi:hypothetical protein